MAYYTSTCTDGKEEGHQLNKYGEKLHKAYKKNCPKDTTKQVSEEKTPWGLDYVTFDREWVSEFRGMITKNSNLLSERRGGAGSHAAAAAYKILSRLRVKLRRKAWAYKTCHQNRKEFRDTCVRHPRGQIAVNAYNNHNKAIDLMRTQFNDCTQMISNINHALQSHDHNSRIARNATVRLANSHSQSVRAIMRRQNVTNRNMGNKCECPHCENKFRSKNKLREHKCKKNKKKKHTPPPMRITPLMQVHEDMILLRDLQKYFVSNKGKILIVQDNVDMHLEWWNDQLRHAKRQTDRIQTYLTALGSIIDTDLALEWNLSAARLDRMNKMFRRLLANISMSEFINKIRHMNKYRVAMLTYIATIKENFESYVSEGVESHQKAKEIRSQWKRAMIYIQRATLRTIMPPPFINHTTLPERREAYDLVYRTHVKLDEEIKMMQASFDNADAYPRNGTKK